VCTALVGCRQNVMATVLLKTFPHSDGILKINSVFLKRIGIQNMLCHVLFKFCFQYQNFPHLKKIVNHNYSSKIGLIIIGAGQNQLPTTRWILLWYLVLKDAKIVSLQKFTK
jgi:hypothetical protein